MYTTWQELKLRLDSKSYGINNFEELLHLGDSNIPYGALYSFLNSWFSSSPTMTLQTSGSTGQPKRMETRKEYMLKSAKMSCQYFKLGPKDTALLCMDLKYIGAMMLVVRAMVCGMRLVVRKPSASPLSDSTLLYEGITFASLVPLQVHESLQGGDILLREIKQIIIGGAALPRTLREKLQTYTNAIYASYGMTETLSHIAIAPISCGTTALLYESLPDVGLSLSTRGTLVVNAPELGVYNLETNDLIEFEGKPQPSSTVRFRVLGRADLIINTGGVKVSIDLLEEKLGHYISIPIAVTRCADERLGEMVVLILEHDSPWELDKALCQKIALALKALPRYHRPRRVLTLKRLPRLESGKLDRQALEHIANT